MGFDVRDIQPTPNPNAQKFVLGEAKFAQPASFLSAAAAEKHPVARRLFAIDGVESVLLLGDFITINKNPQARWSQVSKKVKQTLAELDAESESNQ